jgi:hypothetical protein
VKGAVLALYFDNSVIHPVAGQGAGLKVRSLLDQHAAVVFASVQNLLEAWRNDNTSTRTEVVRTLMRVAASREEVPLQLRAVQAVVSEINVYHPDWLVAAPDLSSQRRHIEVRQQVWERVATDPAYRPANMVAQAPFLSGAVAESLRRQRLRRRARIAGISLPPAVINAEIAARLHPLIEALPEAEAWWRTGAAASWWHAVVEGDRLVGDLRDYLRPYLAVDRLNVEAWMQFWITEANDAALAVTRVQGLADYFQPDHKVESGNWGDINHAGFAVGRDFLLTADYDFFQVLTMISQQHGVTMAAPLLIRRDAPDIVAEIARALRW